MASATLSHDRIESQKSDAPSGALGIAIVKLLVDVGFQHKRIAALFDCNQGRIAEIATGQKGGDVAFHFSYSNGGKAARRALGGKKDG